MLNIKNYFRKYRMLFISISIYIIVFSLLYILLTNNDFILGNDALCQYVVFYKKWIQIIDNLIKNHTFNTYAFDMFLGTDFYSAMGYYCTGDIFIPIIYLFKNNIYVGLLVETIVCIFISGITMSMFLEISGIKNKKAIIISSLLYALGGQAILYYQVFMFHRFYAFLPLMFYGVQLYFKNNRKTAFVFSIAILFLQNFYFMYPTLIVLFLYCIVECLKRKYKLNQILKSFFDLFFSILFGFTISAIVTIPSMLYTYNNVINRTYFNYEKHWNIKTIYSIFYSLLMMNPYGEFGNIFNTNDYYADWHNLFISIIPTIYLVYFFIKSKKDYFYEKLLFVLFIVIMLYKPINSFMHGFAEPALRWLFLLYFYMLYILAIGVDIYVEKDKQKLINIGIVILIIYLVSFSLLYVSDKNLLFENREHLYYAICCFLISVVIFVIFIFDRKLSILFTVIYILISTIFYSIRVSNLTVDTETVIEDELDYKQNYCAKNFRYFISHEDSYYHIPLECNDSLLYNLMTTSTYSSTIETAINRFLSIDDFSIATEWATEISDPNLLTMLGTKYYIIGDEYKSKVNLSSLKYEYSIDQVKKYDVYSNLQYKGFGFSAEKVKYFNQYSNNTNDFVSYIMVDDESVDITKYQKRLTSIPLNINYIGDNVLEAHISLNEDNILLIPLPNNRGWEIKVNNIVIIPISVNGGFIGIELEKGDNNIVMNFHTPYLKESSLVSLIGIVGYIVLFAFEKRHDFLKTKNLKISKHITLEKEKEN